MRLCDYGCGREAKYHINYNKKDCRPKNLITLCRSCNARANFNMFIWQFFYNWLTISRDFKIELTLPETFEELLEV